MISAAKILLQKRSEAESVQVWNLIFSRMRNELTVFMRLGWTELVAGLIYRPKRWYSGLPWPSDLPARQMPVRHWTRWHERGRHLPGSRRQTRCGVQTRELRRPRVAGVQGRHRQSRPEPLRAATAAAQAATALPPLTTVSVAGEHLREIELDVGRSGRPPGRSMMGLMSSSSTPALLLGAMSSRANRKKFAHQDRTKTRKLAFLTSNRTCGNRSRGDAPSYG